MASFIKTLNSCCSAYYDIPDCKEQRKAGFGYGTKLDFTKHNTVTPAPNTYTVLSAFDKDKSKNIGITFGYGRDVID